MCSICFYVCMYLHANHGFMIHGIHAFWMEFSSLHPSDQVQVIINGNTVATLQASIQDLEPTSGVMRVCTFLNMFPVFILFIDMSESNSESIYSRISDFTVFIWKIHWICLFFFVVRSPPGLITKGDQRMESQYLPKHAFVQKKGSWIMFHWHSQQ